MQNSAVNIKLILKCEMSMWNSHTSCLHAYHFQGINSLAYINTVKLFEGDWNKSEHYIGKYLVFSKTPHCHLVHQEADVTPWDCLLSHSH